MVHDSIDLICAIESITTYIAYKVTKQHQGVSRDTGWTHLRSIVTEGSWPGMWVVAAVTS